MIRNILLVLAFAFAVLQFFRPEKNLSNDNTNIMTNKFDVPSDIQEIFKTACNDCHSNHTRYPWYSTIQPVAWWMNNHIIDGKRHYNYAEFSGYRVSRQNEKFGDIAEQMEKNEMPLPSYTLIHKDAILTDAQRKRIIDWAKANQDSLKAHYPADSLVRQRGPQGPPK